MSERKPKFRVGQVVMVRDSWMHQRYAFRICGIRKGKDAPEYWDIYGNAFSEVAVRPLTKREKGEGR